LVKAIFRVSTLIALLAAFFSRNAIAQIAPGVLQSAAQTATITGSVLQPDATPVAGADVRLAGAAQMATKSDTHGTFTFTSVPYGVYTIIASRANLGQASRSGISVKGDLTVTIQYEENANGLKTIARVSTQSAGAQINVSPASIASVSPSAYAFQGNTSWQRLLNQVPGVTVGGALGGGANLPVIPDSPFQPIVLSINGALPYETSSSLDDCSSLTGS